MPPLETSRTREIGVRMALGASLQGVVAGILGSGGRLLLVGIVLGLAVFLALRRFAGALLFGVSPADPLPPFLAALTLLVVGLLAAWGPAGRPHRSPEGDPDGVAPGSAHVGRIRGPRPPRSWSRWPGGTRARSAFAHFAGPVF